MGDTRDSDTRDQPGEGNSDEDFLSRWSRRKQADGKDNAQPATVPAATAVDRQARKAVPEVDEDPRQELTDADELRRRDRQQQDRRRHRNADELPGAGRLLAAMDAGMPSCSGVALGVDRLLMQLTGAASVQDCLPFPMERA